MAAATTNSRQLLCEGVKVILTARDEKRGLEAVEKLKSSSSSSSGFNSNNSIIFHQLQVTDLASIASLALFVESQFGKLDILVNNAGILGVTIDEAGQKAWAAHGFGPNINWDDLNMVQTYEQSVECIQTNYYGAKSVTEALIPLLQLSDSPRIVNVSSGAGKLQYIPNEWAKKVLNDPENLTEEKIDEVINQFLKDFEKGRLEAEKWPLYFSAYMVSKAAFNAYTRILARKYTGFRINCVCPGYVKTDINYNSGVLTVEEGAKGPNIPNEWAKEILKDAENLTYKKIDDVVKVFLEDFKQGLLEAKGWPLYFSAYRVSRAAINAYTRVLARKNPSFRINCVSPGVVTGENRHELWYRFVDCGGRWSKPGEASIAA
ncbi:(+)-neomenthol dehydrogenase [Striga hermonthica]|uniref:(+)-neomenthol dehydrogenase n=1 Tax=Striga hermonthica TaxID=68872 RepID=A0A9N7P4M3_STRHE|nr:(+)-neomenthol dehydrogenase [Striga hermonthica]